MTAKTLSAALALATALWASGATAAFLRDAPNGGDCVRIGGNWNGPGKTCTLTADVNEAISVIDNGLTLDGAGKTVRVNAVQIAVYLSNVSGVTVRNVAFKGYKTAILVDHGSRNLIAGNTANAPSPRTYGIVLERSRTNTVHGNTLSGNGRGIVLDGASNNFVYRNRIGNGDHTAVVLRNQANRNSILFNVIRNNRRGGGISLRRAFRNLVAGNDVDNPNLSVGIELSLFAIENLLVFNTVARHTFAGLQMGNAFGNIALCNDVKANAGRGVWIARGAGNAVYWNNFLGADSATVRLAAPGVHRFSFAKPTGGNYWDSYSPTCANRRDARFCDLPYVFAGDQDGIPHKQPIAWRKGACLGASQPTEEVVP